MITILAALVAAQSIQTAEPLGRAAMAYPYPSPDGSQIVFQGDFDGRWQLYAMRVEDGRIRRLHVSERDDTHPSWSPDGGRIAFISNRDGNDEVYVLDLSSGEVRAIAPHPGKDGHPKWAPDGQALTFNRTFDPADRDGDIDSAIIQADPATGATRVLSDSDRVETFATVSPDGRELVLVEWYPGEDGRPNRNGELVVVNLATGARRNITDTPQFEGFPHWSTDNWIYFSRPSGEIGSPYQLQRMRPDGSNVQILSEGRGDIRGVPTADGGRVIFNRTIDGVARIMSAPLPDAP